MPTPVQKNYTIYIYIYIQYINLFPLRPTSTPPPHSLEVVSSRSKTLQDERAQSCFPCSFPLCCWGSVFTNEIRNKHTKKSYSKCKHSGHHFCYVGCGWVSGGSSVSVDFLSSSGFLFLRRGVL